MPRRLKGARNYVLIAFSLVFYACAGLRFLPLMITSIAVDYMVGLWLNRNGAISGKIILSFGIFIHLALLGWFKYAAFITGALNNAGLSLPVPEIILPVGISFYTFQGISYLIDVYRGDTPAERKLSNLALYISLFPQLIAGPIVRYVDIAHAVIHRQENIPDISSGATRFIVGLGKKVLLSNALAQISDAAFGHAPGTLSISFAWLGILAYTGHIYFDFSGYSDMAIGLGKIFGFTFLENFNYPYIAKSLSEFWRRWHISLSSWFRDYLYIPLGGSRKGKARTIINLLFVWTVTGLWHGAGWTFLIWGLYYALLLIGEKYLWRAALEKAPAFIRHIYALFFIILGWVWFRADSAQAAIQYFMALFGQTEAPFLEQQTVYWLKQCWPELLLAPIACTPVISAVKRKLLLQSDRSWIQLTGLCITRAALILMGILSVSSLLSSGFNPFIYFRF